MQTLLADPLLPHHYSLDAVVATVDGVHGLRGPEALQQVAAADTLVVTKSDIAEPEELDALEAELARLNPAARTVRASFGDVEAELLLSGSDRDVREVPPESNGHTHRRAGGRAHARPRDRLDGVRDLADDAAPRARRRDSRVKGLLDVGGEGPLLVNCVQHAVYPPVHLDAWPDEDRRSRLVVIGHDVDGERSRPPSAPSIALPQQ